MKIPSIIAIFALFWVMSAFLVLPFGVRTHDEAGAERVAGQADSAPHEFRPWRVILRATTLAAILFGLFYLNYVNGWVSPRSFEWFQPPEHLLNG